MQTLEEHSRHVAELCADACRPFGLENTGRLMGWLHDAGKAAPDVQDHLRRLTCDKLTHSAAGMRWIWEQTARQSTSTRLAGQMIALAIGCHHSGRCDCLAPDGRVPWLERMRSDQARALYQPSVDAFFADCCREETLHALIGKAAGEIAVLYKATGGVLPEWAERNVRRDARWFGLGFLQRFLFSALVDADWTDTASFMNGTPLPGAPTDAQRLTVW